MPATSAHFLFHDCVRLIFEHGHLRPDPRSLFEGVTKQTRHVTLRPVDSIPTETPVPLLDPAVDIGRALRSRS